MLKKDEFFCILEQSALCFSVLEDSLKLSDWVKSELKQEEKKKVF